MPDSITINDFSGGWQPSNDATNGPKNALLQMDNVNIDINGALSLVGGTSKVGTVYPFNAHTMFNNYMAGTRYIYSALTDGSIYRSDPTTPVSIATGGHATNAAFGMAYKYVLACSGNTRIKDIGSGTALNLGIVPAAAAPTFTQSFTNAPSALVKSVISTIVTPVGSSAVIASTYLQITATAGTAVVQTYEAGIVATNLNVLVGVGSNNTGYALDSDTISITGYTPAPVGEILKVDILLSAGNSAGDAVADYFTFQVDLGDIEFDPVTGVFTLRIRRDQFTRIGNGTQGWTTVFGFRITYIAPAGSVINILGSFSGVPSIYMMGGSKTQNNTYQYAQVNVNNNSAYVGKSVLGVLSSPVGIENNQVLVTPRDPTLDDAQCNEAWIYRRSIGFDGKSLTSWYRVLVFVVGALTARYDTFSDADAVKLNIKLNEDLVSIASSSIAAAIYDIVGPIEGRWFYFTQDFIYPSDINNPDLVDPLKAIRIANAGGEIFLWARAVSDSVILVGTSADVYILTGTFTTLPDGIIDVYYKGINIQFPPMSYDAEVYDSKVFYMANDGWRSIDASANNPSYVFPYTDILYKGISIQGYTSVILNIAPGSRRYPICIARNKMWCFITLTNRLEVYDFTRKYWHNINYGLGDVTAVTSAKSGQVFAFYGTDKFVRAVDARGTTQVDSTTDQTVNILFPIFNNGTPKQRKDSYTLKSNIFTGAAGSITASITEETNTTTTAGTLTSASSQLDKFINISQVAALALVKSYQVKLNGAVRDFKLTDVTINFDTRPLQVSHLRIPPTNYGTSAKKRIAGFPFSIDTLGVDAILTPKVDNVAQTTLTVNSSNKKSYTYEFPIVSADIIKGVDYEFIISSATGLFEFMGLDQPRNIEVFPEPRKAASIPVSNFGTAQKKRLRVWPFVVDPRGSSITFTPIVDGTAITSLNQSFSHTGKKTVLIQYTEDVFGIDYSGYWSGDAEWELWEVLQPDIVQILPIARRLDQVGPKELFKYGKIKQLEYRVVPFGTSIPYVIYFNDGTIQSSSITVTNGIDKPYYIDLPQGTSGNVVRIVFGPTAFDFHRMSVRIQCEQSGRDTEMPWVDLG